MSKYAGFSSTQLTRPLRSDFDLSHYKRVTTRMGRLTPILLEECIPGDSFHGQTNILIRVAPMLAPIYDSLILFVHFFFTPCRHLWEDWEEFITGGRLGVGIDPLVEPIPPRFAVSELITDAPEDTYIGKSSLLDYCGVPPWMFLPGQGSAAQYAGIFIDAMPIVVYQKVWMDYYRDRNFVADDFMEFPLPSGTIDVSDNIELITRRIRAYEHDYFTSALPFVQRGVEVLMPLAGTGSVNYLAESIGKTSAGALFSADTLVTLSEDSEVTMRPTLATEPGTKGRIENIESIDIDSSDVSINDFRTAYALQVWAERNAVGGSRYNESTLAHFGVRPQDARLQRSEYLGGGRVTIRVSEVVSTAYSEDSEAAVVPLGNMGGHGSAYGNTNGFNYFCFEHGFIIGIVSIMNPPSYHQGLPRMFRRRSFTSYPWPTFAKLGEQQVDKAEIYANFTNLTEDADGVLPLFGYQSRYADWKYRCSSNHGDFHDTQLFWTLTREFAATPVLSEAFVQFDDATQDRIFAAGFSEGLDGFWMYVDNQVRVKRCLPYFGTPNTLGFT